MFSIKPTFLDRSISFLWLSCLHSKGFFYVGVLLSALMILGFESVLKPAHAYIGPGLGLGSLMIVVGLGLSIILAAIAIFWYPIKRILFGQSSTIQEENEDDEDEDDDEDDNEDD
jgi:hypothetical protein